MTPAHIPPHRPVPPPRRLPPEVAFARRQAYLRQKRIKRRRRRIFFCTVFALALCIGGILTIMKHPQLQNAYEAEMPDWVTPAYISCHTSARTGEKLTAVRGIVIHYVGNPGSTAEGNRDYFDSPTTEVSAHFVVGLDGEILQCLPLAEKSAASNHRNSDTISIETCHPDETGKFNDVTYASLVRLTAYLCDRFSLDADDVIRHYDVTGKLCPLYYVEHEDAWETLRADIAAAIRQLRSDDADTENGLY